MNFRRLRRLRRRRWCEHVRERRDRVRERLSLRRIDDRDLAVAGHLADRRRRGVDAAKPGQRELLRLVLHAGELELVRERVGDVGVGDAAFGAADDAGDAGTAAGAHAGRPVDARARADLALPGRARLRQEVGEVVRRARAVRPVDGRDLQVGQVDVRVQLLDPRRVPLLDRPQVHLRDQRRRQLQTPEALPGTL